jgi:hypothetical protein
MNSTNKFFSVPSYNTFQQSDESSSLSSNAQNKVNAEIIEGGIAGGARHLNSEEFRCVESMKKMEKC